MFPYFCSAAYGPDSVSYRVENSTELASYKGSTYVKFGLDTMKLFLNAIFTHSDLKENMANVWFTFLSLAILWTRAFLTQASAESIQCDGLVPSLKPRLFILSDIGSDPDDAMSVVRLLLYSNQLNLRGLCATTSLFQTEPQPEQLTRIVEAYELIVNNLNRHVSAKSRFSSSDKILPLVTSGPKVSSSIFCFRE